MAVVISKLKPTITCPVKLYLPGDNGELECHVFSAVFRRVTGEERDEINKLYVLGEEVPLEPQPADAGEAPRTRRVTLTNAQLLDRVLVGWSGMLDAAGNAVPYTHEERRATEAVYPGLEQALVVSWYDHSFINQREAATKNSKAPSGTTTGSTAQAASS